MLWTKKIVNLNPYSDIYYVLTCNIIFTIFYGKYQWHISKELDTNFIYSVNGWIFNFITLHKMISVIFIGKQVTFGKYS